MLEKVDGGHSASGGIVERAQPIEDIGPDHLEPAQIWPDDSETMTLEATLRRDRGGAQQRCRDGSRDEAPGRTGPRSAG